MTWNEYINSKKTEWIGKKVMYKDHMYNVVDVDYNGALLIDLPNDYNLTTAISESMVENKKMTTQDILDYASTNGVESAADLLLLYGPNDFDGDYSELMNMLKSAKTWMNMLNSAEV